MLRLKQNYKFNVRLDRYPNAYGIYITNMTIKMKCSDSKELYRKHWIMWTRIQIILWNLFHMHFMKFLALVALHGNGTEWSNHTCWTDCGTCNSTAKLYLKGGPSTCNENSSSNSSLCQTYQTWQTLCDYIHIVGVQEQAILPIQ